MDQQHGKRSPGTRVPGLKAPSLRALGLPTWQIAVILALALSIGVAVALVAFGILLIALPIAILAAFAYRLFGKRRASRQATIINGEYEVIDGARAENNAAYRNRR